MVSADPKQYQGFARHVTYFPRRDKHLIERMVEHIVEQCPALVGVPLNPAVRAVYTGRIVNRTQLTNYVLMPSQGVGRISGHKEWGTANFGCLAEMLKCAGYCVVQVGLAGDQRLRAADEQHLQLSLEELVGLVRGSRMVVSLENGLSHLAGHLMHPCTTLYLHRDTQPLHTGYVNQYSIVGEPAFVTPEQVYKRITTEIEITNGEQAEKRNEG